MHIFLLTGEPSGDLHGAHLARALRSLHPDITITGVGGTRMRQAGVTLSAESEHWGAIGIPEALRKVPSLFVEMRRLVRHLTANPPDALVLIDFGAFNVRLLHRLRGSAIPTIYFIPPGCWSRHRAPGQLPFLVDAVATPFPWSVENLRAAGAPVRIEWVGHPLLEYTRDANTRAAARQLLGINDDRPVVALVPGSRRSEVQRLMPVFVETVRRLDPVPEVLVSVAPSIGEAALRALLPPEMPAHFLDGIDYTRIRAADAALVASGTATLELACLDLPMVVAYRGSLGTWIQYQILVRTRGLRHVALPNILAEKTVVPERLQAEASPETLARDLAELLYASPARGAQRQAFTAIRSWLGDGQACAHTARLILDTVASRGVTPSPRVPAATDTPTA